MISNKEMKLETWGVT